MRDGVATAYPYGVEAYRRSFLTREFRRKMGKGTQPGGNFAVQYLVEFALAESLAMGPGKPNIGDTHPESEEPSGDCPNFATGLCYRERFTGVLGLVLTPIELRIVLSRLNRGDRQ